ncbi:MAG TPA: glycine dehydrogenase, partial [Actinomycetota bacterium]|nr:glycine dehydrogenase [Actinomycetota bacterium]
GTKLEDAACVIVQYPDGHGVLGDARSAFAAARKAGARAIEIFDPLSLGVLASPGELGADIAVAEGQVLGNHLNYGGPYLGIIAARTQDIRRMPGRIAGETSDVDGNPGYVLTLQTREQHIRREKATSNICTNQTLMAIAASVYLAWLGPQGLVELGEACAAKARYAAERLVEAGARLAHPDEPFFKEFAITFDRPAEQVRDTLIEVGYLVGPVVDGALLVACTERRTREDIDGLAEALGEVLA